MATKIVGIAGKARSGKDTVAGFLREHFNYDVYSFAQPIRDITKYLLLIDEEYIEGGKKEDKLDWVDTSYREFAQKLGTEFVREMIDQDFWIKRAVQYVKQYKPEYIVIPDVRFENEAEWIRKQGGIVWHLDRPDVVKVRDHISEAGVSVDKGDPLISNKGSLGDLYKVVEKIVLGNKFYS